MGILVLYFLVCDGILWILDIQLMNSPWNPGVLYLKIRLCCRILFLSFGRSTCLLENILRRHLEHLPTILNLRYKSSGGRPKINNK